MAKILITYSIIFGVFANQAFAGKTGRDLFGEDIKTSTQRIQRTFTQRPQQNSIMERGISVGEISSTGEEFYITYRPSLGMEILNCVDKSSFPLVNVGLNLSGNGHKGITQLFSKEDVKATVVAPFMQYKDETRFSTEQMTIFIDGMSAGAHRAVETAIYLKQNEDTKNHNVIVLRYGDAKTFDEVAVNAIHNLLEKENIISFHGEGDKIVEFMDMDRANSSIGTRVNFSALESENYRTRVSNRTYTCMEPGIKGILTSPFSQLFISGIGLNSGMLSFLTPELWELHQPITYSELCPLAFDTHRKK
ncbi:MAG: hypothetical protein K2W92_06525 [Alphaproteobacteria bacterium]|nr:hypothetical protein [Alphaproteobacteria bacterium]